MKGYVLIMVLSFIGLSVGATIDNTFSAQIDGVAIRGNEVTWASTGAGTYEDGAAADAVLTGPGITEYQVKENLDAKMGNFYKQTGYLRSERNALFKDSSHIEASDPKQIVTIQHDGIMNSVELDSAKTIDGQNLSAGQQIAWNGAGIYSRDVEYDVGAERETLGVQYSYRLSGKDHSTLLTNLSGGGIARPEFSYTGFSDLYIFNDTALGLNATETNVTVNQTA